MALQDLEPLWSFFLQKLRKCLAPRYEELKSRQDILFEVTYEAYLSSVYDVLENPLNEFAYLERLLVLNNYEETSSSVIRVKSQKNFVMKIQTINADIAKKCSVNNVFTSDTSGVQQLFLVLNEVARIEQLQSNCKTLEAFTHILIASLVPLISLGACKYKVCDNTGKLKFVEQFQPIYEQAKTRDDGFFLLNSITSFLLVTEKSKDILKNLCKLSDQEEVNKGLEAVLARLKLITANLKRKMTPIPLTMPCHDEIEQKQFTSKENINHYHNFLMAAPSAALSSTQLTPFSSESQEEKHKTQTVDLETRNLNCFLLKASTSLKNSVKMTKKAVPSVNLEEAQDKNNIKNCNFPLLYHIEKVIKDELANSAVNTAQFTLSTIVSEYLLMDHIKGLRSILFMQNGIVMEQFCIELVRKIEVVTRWNQESWLTLSLHNFMSNERLTWFCGFVSVKLSCRAPTSVNSSALPELTINYAVPWPINIIIKPESLELYNNVFKFLLEIKCSIVILQKLSFRDLGPTSAVRNRLFWLRIWMMHFLTSVYCYFMECVLEPAYLTFDSQVCDCSNLENLALLHHHYVCDIHRGCFLDQGYEFLNQPIREIANFTEPLTASWKGMSSDEELYEIQDKFLYRYEYVVSVLNSAACRSTFPYVETLASSLKFKHPR